MIIHTHGLSGPQLDEVTNIWLTANLEAHWFINGNYWRNYYAEVKPQIGDSELFLYEEANVIQGFLGIEDNYIAGLFVDKRYRGQGIGRELIAAAKRTRNELTLSVYEKNQAAYQFYLKQGFIETSRGIDPVTNERAINMAWRDSASKRRGS
ncbi:GNAT family N-acetyltransferase [Lentilactobacillus sp. IMAU92037]|uniref:GNAT family N-acetyltransferase n=1 Tax=Lentilactobacillus dabitei TaxID=2831523 RepID=UPI001C27F8C3|nr:GNAT family N-acetyltransferase [Lentilactobacillus dabitei]MBU9788113.1 GNAT family N-acetyltransferase [Lentilactobacillus dabitei]MBV0931265.1 GNAT family N-acetyltransferase [Lentilactobacillus dabitei]